MFTRILGKPKEPTTSAVATLDKLSETLEMLEKKEQVLLKKAAAEVEKAKEFTRAKNKRAAEELALSRHMQVDRGKQRVITELGMRASRSVSTQVYSRRNSFGNRRMGVAVRASRSVSTQIWPPDALLVCDTSSPSTDEAKGVDPALLLFLFEAAIQCLKRKRLYEQQIENLGHMQLRIHDQMILLEGAKATTETVDALRSGASAMKAMQKATNIDNVDKTMDEINEQTENLKQIQEALSAPMGAAADFDEDELEAELEELEGAELEEQLLQPATTAPAAPVHVPAGKQPPRPASQKSTAEEDELAALQAEMAL
ncbi:hypothetical protein Cgig2_016828 [Carnegiea gigantea]|uniref:Uncharacterized protein n=1 Tax=Carnegiea gigantea TaxID=171969 RepID=A0A9Q1K9C5_9CARY|nr:hypothetical protein Cgig2_016828 [Carnegiea gigantea]